MRRRIAAAVSRRPLALSLALAAIAVTAAGMGASGAVFTSETSNPGNTLAAAPDWTAPTITASVASRNSGPVTGEIKPGATYSIYANVSDSGNPASGVSTVTADVGLVTGGQLAVPLLPGSYVVDGVTYNYKSAILTADLGLAAGPRAYSITAEDGASNSRSNSSFGLTVDTTPPTASDVQTANMAATIGKAEAGDTIRFTYSEPMDPGTILGGWVGTTNNVVVRINNAAGNDNVAVYDSANIVQTGLGTVTLGGNYVAANRTFGATGTPSTITQSGSTITVTLGTASGTTTTATAPTSLIWTPSAFATDRAGNGAVVAPAIESGAADVEF